MSDKAFHDYAAMDRAENRLECLKLAQAAESVDYSGRSQGAITNSVLDRAKEYADFVNGPPADGGVDTEADTEAAPA